MRNENVYLLFITDECTRYTRGQVIKSKQPKEVTEAIEDNWVRKGPDQDGQAKVSIATGARFSVTLS